MPNLGRPPRLLLLLAERGQAFRVGVFFGQQKHDKDTAANTQP